MKSKKKECEKTAVRKFKKLKLENDKVKSEVKKGVAHLWAEFKGKLNNIFR